ncbi:hypothetical protein NDA12_005005 [Ustilago hordei]|nr:hypothetical protein NDA12_005005 [Ustilago hordei]
MTGGQRASRRSCHVEMPPERQSPRSPKRQRIDSSTLPKSLLVSQHERSGKTNHSASSRQQDQGICFALAAPSAKAPTLAAKPSRPLESSNSSLSSAKKDAPAAHKRRFTRSRYGCSTCRARKVKCDEARPRCRRCLEDGQTCEGYGEQQAPQREQHHSSLNPSSSSSKKQALSQSYSSPFLRNVQESYDPHSLSLQATTTANGEAFADYSATSPQHLDDWIDLLCASIGNDMPQPAPSTVVATFQKASTKYTTMQHKQVQHPEPTSASMRLPSSHHDISSSNSSRSADEQGLSTLANAAVATTHASSGSDSPPWLNEDWLRSTTSHSNSLRNESPARVGIILLQHNSTMLSPAFSRHKRLEDFFAQLASESPIILDLIGCLGLTHLSLSQDHRKKGLAHAHFSRCKTEWDGLVGPLDTPESIQAAAKDVNTPHRTLEALAGTILIAHIEQFNRGFATSSRAYTAVAIAIVRRVLSCASEDTSSAPWLEEMDQGPGSAFRFFVRILLWWETMSRTMGPASEQGDVLDIFQHVYRWEEVDGKSQDPVECLTQCVVGWPLDLLEAVERTTRTSTDAEVLAYQPTLPTSPPIVMPSGTLSHALEGHVSLELQQQIDSVETQIRLARPLPLAQDDSIAAELRYLIFECLQSASLVYFSKVLLKSTDAVWFEIDKVTRFLERKQQRPSGSAVNLDVSQTDTNRKARLSHIGSTSGWSSSVPADQQLAQAMETRGHWWIRAPDGALIWAYFQCASEIFGALDPSTELIIAVANQQERHQIGKGDPVKLALGSQLTLGSEAYDGFAQSRSERRQGCRRSLLLWERFDEVQCVFLCRHLLKAIWGRRDLYEEQARRTNSKDTAGSMPTSAMVSSQERYDQAAEIGDICRQRRWRQPLIF